MKRAALASLVVALVATHARGAHALGSDEPSEQDATVQEQAPPPPAPTPPDEGRSHLALSVAAVGDYRRLYDLSVLAAGFGLSLGCACEKAGGSAELRGTVGRTAGGLSVTEIALGGSAELPIASGMFLGLGGALTAFGIQRATSGGEILSVGPELFGRVGYRFATRAAPFVTLDGGGQLQGGWTLVWDATLAAGYRF